MKILFPIGAFYPSQIGGPCNTVYWHACALVKNDIEVKVITTTIGIEDGKVITNIDHTTTCGEVYYGKGGILKGSTILQIFRNIKQFDVIHLNSLFNAFSIASFFYARLFYRKKHFVWSVRGELSNSALKFSGWKKKPILLIYKKLTKGIVFHSTSAQETKDIGSVFQNSKIIEIPNLIEPSKRFENVEIKKQLLFVGRIHPIKSIHKLISALSMSSQFLSSDFKLIIVGKYEERHRYYYEELISLITTNNLENKLEFRGHVEGDDKERLYAESYITILPSETENFGNVVVESLNQGTPVIASLGTPWGVLGAYNCGLHVSNEPGILANAIDQFILKSKEAYASMRQNSVQLIENEFSIENQIFQWIDQYKMLYNV